jgi:hypothetical protein
MKYIFLILWSLVFASYSGSEVDDSNSESKSSSEHSVPSNMNSSFNMLPSDMIRYIAGFIDARDLIKWRNVNVLNRSSLTLKWLVEQTFSIFGLENVADDEPELAGMMRLAWISHDHFILFTALMEEVVGGKKPYRVLFHPLILHLIRTFRQLGPQEMKSYRKRISVRLAISVEIYLANICATKGHFDLVFEIYRDFARVLKNFVTRFENREELMAIFKADPQLARQYLDILLADSNNNIDIVSIKRPVSLWISECILNDLSMGYYEQLFNDNPELLESLVNYLFLSTNVPESEYARIYYQISYIFDMYSGELANTPKFAVLRMINDIRFGSFGLNDFIHVDFGSIDKNLQLVLTKVALLANKMELFNDIFRKYKSILGEKVVDKILRFYDLNASDHQAKSFSIIFFWIVSGSETFASCSYLLTFVNKFYAVRHLKLENDMVTFEFSASEHLSSILFPPVLRISISSELNFAQAFIENSLKNMKVFNENTMTTFIYDLIEYYKIRSKPQKGNLASYEVFKMISKLPDLLRHMKENGMELKLSKDAEILGKYFDLDNFDSTHELIAWSELDPWKLTNLKTQDHLAKMEIIHNKNVGESFLEWDCFSLLIKYLSGQGHASIMYFEWRSVFAYWLGRYAGNGMRQIRTPEFIEMLKLDFPNETKELF